MDYEALQARIKVEQWLCQTVARSIYRIADVIGPLRSISELLPQADSKSQANVSTWLDKLAIRPKDEILRANLIQDQLLSLWAVMIEEEALASHNL